MRGPPAFDREKTGIVSRAGNKRATIGPQNSAREAGTAQRTVKKHRDLAELKVSRLVESKERIEGSDHFSAEQRHRLSGGNRGSAGLWVRGLRVVSPAG